VDRSDGNITKKANQYRTLSWTFRFQEAVANLPEDPSIDIRVLMSYYRGIVSSSAAEENCICGNWPFACIAVLTVDEYEWDKYSLFAHEFGHSLGYSVTQ